MSCKTQANSSDAVTTTNGGSNAPEPACFTFQAKANELGEFDFGSFTNMMWEVCYQVHKIDGSTNYENANWVLTNNDEDTVIPVQADDLYDKVVLHTESLWANPRPNIATVTPTEGGGANIKTFYGEKLIDSFHLVWVGKMTCPYCDGHGWVMGEDTTEPCSFCDN